MPFMFEKLEVYQKAVSLSERVISITEKFPRGFYFLADQRGSVQECVPLIEITKRRGLINDAGYESFKDDLEVISKMLSGLIRGIENRKN